MILSISEEVKKFFNGVTRFVEDNADNLIFWVVLVAVIVVITYFAISKLGEK